MPPDLSVERENSKSPVVRTFRFFLKIPLQAIWNDVIVRLCSGEQHRNVLCDVSGNPSPPPSLRGSLKEETFRRQGSSQIPNEVPYQRQDLSRTGDWVALSS